MSARDGKSSQGGKQGSPGPDGGPRGNRRQFQGRYRKSIERREQILQTALEVFAEHGDRGTSLQEIADRVGITQPALLYYFGTREELLLAVLERRDTLGTQVAEDAVTPGDAVAEALRHTMAQPGLIKLFVALSAAATDPAHRAHGFFADRYRDLTTAIADEVAEGQEAGRMRADADPEHVARLLLAVMNGLQLQWLMDPSVDMVAMVETFMRLCTNPPQPPDEAAG